jgi:PEP-CTERM motif
MRLPGGRMEAVMITSAIRHVLVGLSALALWSIAAPSRAQTETLFQPVGMDTQRVFSHTSLPGATGIDFSFAGGISPTYGPEETHTLVTWFEWGPTIAGPWTASPDNVNTVHGGVTTLMSTGVYRGPVDAPFVAIHFAAGGLMTVSGAFTHASVVPEPDVFALLIAGLVLVGAAARRKPDLDASVAATCLHPARHAALP